MSYWLEDTLQFCMMIISVMFPLMYAKDLINEFPLLAQPPIIIIIGIGGLGFYVIFGTKLHDIMDEKEVKKK